MQYDANEFYPTPPELIADMLSGIDLDTIGTILEPSAGKGDIIKYLLGHKDKYSRRTLDSYRETVANSQYFLVNDTPERLLPLCG